MRKGKNNRDDLEKTEIGIYAAAFAIVAGIIFGVLETWWLLVAVIAFLIAFITLSVLTDFSAKSQRSKLNPIQHAFSRLYSIGAWLSNFIRF